MSENKPPKETTKERVGKLDAGLRHRAGKTGEDFVAHYCKTFRQAAYATRDDSWNELEKLVTHVLGMLIYHQRRSEILGLPSDPRDFVWRVDDAERALQEALGSAYEKDD